jgi:hypothetical protein
VTYESISVASRDRELRLRQSNIASPIMTLILLLAGCAASHVTPMAMAQPGDDQLSCRELFERITGNRTSVQKFAIVDRKVEDGNVAKTAISVVPIVGILSIASIDLSNKEQITARSLEDRNDHLSALARSKGCGET